MYCVLSINVPTYVELIYYCILLYCIMCKQVTLPDQIIQEETSYIKDTDLCVFVQVRTEIRLTQR